MPAAHQRLYQLVTDVIAAAEAGIARTDVPPAELAAAAALPSPDSRERLLDVTWAGLSPPRSRPGPARAARKTG